MSEIDIIISIIAVAIVFLFGVEKFSHQIQAVAGNRLKKILGHFTKTPLRGFFAGTVATSVLQSSTVTTVMTVSLVHARLVSFRNSLGLIFGANVGTALSTSLIALKVLNLSPYILIAGFFLMKVRNKYQRYGKSLFYFGLIFSSLFLISVLVEPFRENPAFLQMIEHTSNIVVAVVAGIVLTVILQSSTIVLGMIIILAGFGSIDFSQAFGIILGANIGTTSTTLIASLMLDRSAKRTAVAHLIFSLIGVICVLPFSGYIVSFIQSIPASAAHQVALGHLLFNIVFALIFLIFINRFTKLVERLVP